MHYCQSQFNMLLTWDPHTVLHEDSIYILFIYMIKCGWLGWYKWYTIFMSKVVLTIHIDFVWYPRYRSILLCQVSWKHNFYVPCPGYTIFIYCIHDTQYLSLICMMHNIYFWYAWYTIFMSPTNHIWSHKYQIYMGIPCKPSANPTLITHRDLQKVYK